MFLKIICRSVVLNSTRFPIEMAGWIKVMSPVLPAKAFNPWCIHSSVIQSLLLLISTGELVQSSTWNVGSTFSGALPPSTSAPGLSVENTFSFRQWVLALGGDWVERGSHMGGRGHLMQNLWREPWHRCLCRTEASTLWGVFEKGILNKQVEVCVDKGRQFLKVVDPGNGRTVRLCKLCNSSLNESHRKHKVAFCLLPIQCSLFKKLIAFA